MVNYANFQESPSRLTIPQSDLTATISAEKEERTALQYLNEGCLPDHAKGEEGTNTLGSYRATEITI